MKRFISMSAALLFASQLSFGQNFLDAYRYSTNIFTGSARFSGMAGSFGALGGDFSVTTINPAGLGVYRTNDFSFTPSFNNNKTSSTYLGSSFDDNRFAIGISSIGLVTTFKNPDQTEGNRLVSFNFAIGYNKLRDYNSNSFYNGRNDHWSITDQFAVNANQFINGSDAGILSNSANPFDHLGPGYWESIMAWNNFLIDTSTNPTNFIGILQQGEAVFQEKTLMTRGSLGEYSISFAGNIAEKFFIGGTLGIQDLYYKYSSTYTEDGYVGTHSGLENLTYKEDFETIGSGVNFKLGMIYKTTHSIRFGFAFHTPTFFNLSDKYHSSMSAKFNYGGYIPPVATPTGEFAYSIVTPYRFIGSVGGLVLDKLAFNLDYELADYSVMRLRDDADGSTFQDQNRAIKNIFGVASSLRAGLEYHDGPLFLRGGYAFYGSPMKSGYLNDNSNTQVFALGFGIRTGSVYTDFAFNKSVTKYEYYIYGDHDLVNEKSTQNQFVVTLGYKF